MFSYTSCILIKSGVIILCTCMHLSYVHTCLIGCPRFWRITKNSLQSEGIYKWVNLEPIFFWYKLLPTTFGPQKFAKISVFKVDSFVLSIFLVQNLGSVAQIEWKKHPCLFFYFWFKNKQVWTEKIGKKTKKFQNPKSFMQLP